MKVTPDITKDLEAQFQRLIESEDFDPASGYAVEKIKKRRFPDHTELYHFAEVTHNIPIYMTSTNAPDSEWYLIHMNIGVDMQLKRAEKDPNEKKRFAPSGVVMFCPGVVVKTDFAEGHRSELASIRLPKRLLLDYYGKDFIDNGQLLVYEDEQLEFTTKVRKAITAMDNRLKCHVLVLEIIELLLEKIRSNASRSIVLPMHHDDIQKVLEAAEDLSDPIAKNLPSITKLAEKAKMSPSKFKSSFKKFYGLAPHQYHFKIKMEYARKELSLGRKSPLELSYELDYSHPSNFTAAYKRFFNTVPSSDYLKVPIDFHN